MIQQALSNIPYFEQVMEVAARIGHTIDLVLIAFLLWSLCVGAARGLLGTVIGFVGRIFAVLAACLTAKQFAPALAKAVVTPLIAQFISIEQLQEMGISDALQPFVPQITDLAAVLAEGIAFLLLSLCSFAVFSLLIGALTHVFGLLTRFPPLGLLNRLAGAALGLLSGLGIIWLLLRLSYAIRPELFGPLGWLSPQNIQHATLLHTLLTYFPIR